MASVEDDLTVICSRGIKITADTKIELCQNNTYDAIALPVSLLFHLILIIRL